MSPSSSGMTACDCAVAPRVGAGQPTNADRIPGPSCTGVPKPIWKAHRNQTTNTSKRKPG